MLFGCAMLRSLCDMSSPFLRFQLLNHMWYLVSFHTSYVLGVFMITIEATVVLSALLMDRLFMWSLGYPWSCTYESLSLDSQARILAWYLTWGCCFLLGLVPTSRSLGNSNCPCSGSIHSSSVSCMVLYRFPSGAQHGNVSFQILLLFLISDRLQIYLIMKMAMSLTKVTV